MRAATSAFNRPFKGEGAKGEGTKAATRSARLAMATRIQGEASSSPAQWGVPCLNAAAAF
jgi:hypothetical protein